MLRLLGGVGPGEYRNLRNLRKAVGLFDAPKRQFGRVSRGGYGLQMSPRG